MALTSADTVVVLYTDAGYFSKARRTILDLRTRGQWGGEIVVITQPSFNLNEDFKLFYDITNIQFPLIDKTALVQKLPPAGFNGSDKRELHKLLQWEKFHVFDQYFKKWSRVIFVDAGMRILDSVAHLLDLNYKGKILAPNDAGFYDRKDKIFRDQISFHDLGLIESLNNEFGFAYDPSPACGIPKDRWLDSHYFLNCIWVFDTSLLNIITKEVLIEYMYKYPLCRTNEMTIMNLIFHYKFKVWEAFPKRNKLGKILFEWSESNHNFATTWRNFCYIKYPSTIGDI
jgi:hypothetical protein